MVALMIVMLVVRLAPLLVALMEMMKVDLLVVLMVGTKAEMSAAKLAL